MAQSKAQIPDKIFFKIGEVCKIVGVEAHVLRYWETEFPMLSPKKNKSGQRTYRRKDVEIAIEVRDLLYEDLYTIAGARKRLRQDMRGAVDSSGAREAVESNGLSIGDQPSLLSSDRKKPGKGNKTPSKGAARLESEHAGLDDERNDALKSLISELLELREMVKAKGSGDIDNFKENNKQI